MLAWVLKDASGGTSKKDEDLMGKGAAGEKKTQILLDTMVFYNGLYFALRSSREHSQLGVCLA